MSLFIKEDLRRVRFSKGEKIEEIGVDGDDTLLNGEKKGDDDDADYEDGYKRLEENRK